MDLFIDTTLTDKTMFKLALALLFSRQEHTSGLRPGCPANTHLPGPHEFGPTADTFTVFLGHFKVECERWTGRGTS